jgi:NADP-dependent 3-hydroxy acid dehydrogenase YdfG
VREGTGEFRVPAPPSSSRARSGCVSPGAVDTELPSSVKAEGVSGAISDYYEQNAIPADSFARCVLFAMSQPDDVDINEILFRPTKQKL